MAQGYGIEVEYTKTSRDGRSWNDKGHLSSGYVTSWGSPQIYKTKGNADRSLAKWLISQNRYGKTLITNKTYVTGFPLLKNQRLNRKLTLKALKYR